MQYAVMTARAITTTRGDRGRCFIWYYWCSVHVHSQGFSFPSGFSLASNCLSRFPFWHTVDTIRTYEDLCIPISSGHLHSIYSVRSAPLPNSMRATEHCCATSTLTLHWFVAHDRSPEGAAHTAAVSTNMHTRRVVAHIHTAAHAHTHHSHAQSALAPALMCAVFC
jgi:hypothetical protein